MGKVLAETAGKVIEALTFHEEGILDWKVQHLAIPIREVPPKNLEEARKTLTEHPKPLWTDETRTQVDGKWMRAAQMLSVHLLREREGDIPLLADHFLQKFSTVNNKLVKGISDETMEMLKRYPWPGNVRELHNVIEHSVLLAEGEVITPDDLPSEVRGLEASCPVREDLPYREAKKAWMHRFEREYFLALLRRHNGNISQAARTAGVSRKTIQRFLKAYRSRP